MTDGKAVEWMEKVSDAEFNAPLEGQPLPAAASGPSRAQILVGAIAPKLAEVTDNVLFGDVWARPQLARRDRTLVTVSALIAMNRPEQLRSQQHPDSGRVVDVSLDQEAGPEFRTVTIGTKYNENGRLRGKSGGSIRSPASNLKKFADSAWFFRLLRQHNAGISKMTLEREIS